MSFRSGKPNGAFGDSACCGHGGRKTKRLRACPMHRSRSLCFVLTGFQRFLLVVFAKNPRSAATAAMVKRTGCRIPKAVPIVTSNFDSPEA